jgi:hypothetical protein
VRGINILSTAVLESIAQIYGSVVLDRDSNLLAFGAILRHNPAVDGDEEVGEGGRTAAAIGASQFGEVLMISEGGQLSFCRKGHEVDAVSASHSAVVQPERGRSPL